METLYMEIVMAIVTRMNDIEPVVRMIEGYEAQIARLRLLMQGPLSASIRKTFELHVQRNAEVVLSLEQLLAI